MIGSQQVFNLLTQEDLEETIRQAKKRIQRLRRQGNHWKANVMRRELWFLERLLREMVEFGDYRVDGAGVVWKKEK